MKSFTEGGMPAVGGDAAVQGAAGSGSITRTALSVNDFISKTKNGQRQGLKPSGPELMAYARYLGIDPVADHDLLWIATEALEAPLPSEWTEHFDSNDRVFYYNATMRVSSWTHPLEHIYRETYKTMVEFRNARRSQQEQWEKYMELEAEVQELERKVHMQISHWTEHTDENNNRFYFNREERQSTWTDPRPAKCQILYLHMRMLRVLKHSLGTQPAGLSERAAPRAETDDLSQAWPSVGSDHSEMGSHMPEAESPGYRDKKKKKKKKDKDKDKDKDRDKEKERAQPRDQSPPVDPPGKTRNSQREPHASGMRPAAGAFGGGMGGGAAASDSMGALEKAAEASPLGQSSELDEVKARQRKKTAGIKLEPIKLEPIGQAGRPAADAGEDQPPRRQGPLSSASVPALQP